jgi:molybdate transport system substrate-binding protein
MRSVFAAAGLALALLLTACQPPKAQPAEVVVSAAASLADVLKELQPAYEAQHPEVRLKLNFGSSGALQQQIEQGAPADLFIAAAAAPMASLVQKGLVDRAAVTTVATNDVVLIAAAGGTVRSWQDVAAVPHLALGDPQHVPAGQYGKAVLESLGLWSTVSQAQGRLVLGEDARQVLNYVASGAAEAGIVYRTDAATAPKVAVVAAAPAGSHPLVVYPMAVIRDSKHQAEAKAFAEYLLSPAGRQVFAKYGFGQEGQP